VTQKQKMFCDEYLIDLNATRAYLAIYKNCKSEAAAKAAASRLLTFVNLKIYIEERLEEIKTAKTADAQEVLEYLTSVLRGESEAEIVVVEGGGEGCSSARRISKAPDEKERLKAAELLGKRYMLFTDKSQIDLNVPVVFAGENELED